MTNKLCYLALIVVSLLVFAIVYRKSRDKHMFALWFGTAGVCYFLEAFIHTTLKAYQFFPHFERGEYADSLWGGEISDLFVLPAAAVLVGVFQLGWGWMAVVSGIVTGIEALFLKLGVYDHHWWRTWFTFVGCVLLFILAKGWYGRLIRSHGRGLTFLTLLSILYLMGAQSYISIQVHLKQGRMSLKWLDSLGVNGTVLLVPLSLSFALILVILIVLRVRWWWKAALIAGFTGVDFILCSLKILHPKSYWLFVWMLLARLMIVFVGMAFYRLLRKHEGNADAKQNLPG